MAVIVYGKSFFGLVDRVEGEYHVATLFRHVQYLPLIPVGSFIVLEDENGRDTDDARPIPLHGRSVALGYFRGWLGGVAFFSAVLGFVMASGYFFGKGHPVAFIGSLVVAVGLIWAAIGPRGWLFLPGQMTFHGLSAVLVVAGMTLPGAEVGGASKEASFWIPLVVANVVLFGYSLSRIGQDAGPARARELDDLLAGDDEPAHFEVVDEDDAGPRRRSRS